MLHSKFVAWTLALGAAPAIAAGSSALTPPVQVPVASQVASQEASQEASQVVPAQGGDAARQAVPAPPARQRQSSSSIPASRTGPVRSLFDTLGGQPPFLFELDEQLDALDLALAQDAEGRLGAQVRSGAALLGPAFRPEAPQRYRVNLVTGTGTLERVWVQEVSADEPRPLLVVFHRFGVSELDAIVTTRYFEEARRRGWYVLAPRSWGGIHFSSLTSQIHTERALTWALSNFNIDASRIYAVGFSMGGGAALNYAARHLDPDEPRFAAVASLSALLSHEDAYANESTETRNVYDAIFGTGAPGSYDPWLMLRSSLFNMDPLLLQVVPGTDLARNLSHVHLSIYRTNADVPYLMTQHDVFVGHLASLPLVSAQHQSAVVNYPGHSWDAVDEREICDWLRQHRLVAPTAARTLADENGVYFHFELTQDAPGAFSPFEWSVDAQANALSLTATENVQSIRVRTLAAGLSSAGALQVTLSAADGFPDEVVLTDWPVAPSQVLRDGFAWAGWLHDPLSSELTLVEPDAASHVWTVVP